MNSIAFIEILEKRLLEQEVDNEEEAYKLYCAYAHALGFSVRKGKNLYNYGTKNVKGKMFHCSKEGIKDEKNASNSGYPYHRLLIRTGCKATVLFSVLESGKWKVVKFVKEHNHEMAQPHEQHLLRSARTILNSHNVVLDPRINGFPFLVEFTKKDMDTVNSLIDGGDAQSLLNHFKKKANEDRMFYWDVQFDQEGRICNIFWRDGQSRSDYDCFGDVLSFDTKFRMNTNGVICAPFIGINHHSQNIMFGCGLLSDQKKETFEWLFTTFLESMGNKSPVTFFSDQDQAIENSVEKVFTQTSHRLCQWNILKNAPSHLKSDKNFNDLFVKCLSDCESEDEFEQTWSRMMNEFDDVKDNPWFQNFYTIRNKWSSAYNTNVFDGGIKSTSRCETINNILNSLGNKYSRLIEFVVGFEEMILKWRENEKIENFRCRQGMPSCSIKYSPILNQAANFYTHKMYKIFEEEFLDGLGGTSFKEISSNKFEVSMHGRDMNKVRIVEVDLEKKQVWCSCNMFETMGMLCSHALKAFVVKDIHEIPKTYVIKRWSKHARDRFNEIEARDFGKESEIVYSNSVMGMVHDLVMQSKSYEGARLIVYDVLKSGAVKLSEFLSGDAQSVKDNEILDIDINGAIQVLNPPLSVGSKRKSNESEKNQEMRKKVTNMKDNTVKNKENADKSCQGLDGVVIELEHQVINDKPTTNL